MKVCYRCKDEKPRTSEFFWKSKQSKDGFYSYCKNCASTVHKELKKKESAKEVSRKYHRAYRAKDKLTVFEGYCGKNIKCSCLGCNEHRLEFLTIDHINGGGRKHRKEITGAFYRWLIHNQFPEGFRVLCMNCNHSLGLYGYCPHEREKQ